MSNEWDYLQQLDLGPGWGWEYNSSPGDDHSLTKEHWQYQDNGEEFQVKPRRYYWCNIS